MISEKDVSQEFDSLADFATSGPSAPEIARETTLVEVLGHRAEVLPERVAYRFLEDGEEEGESVTYAELHRRASALGAFLQKSGAAGGTRERTTICASSADAERQ